MTITEALETIKNKRWIASLEKYREAINLITETVCKYQKIEQILDDCDFETLEVLEKIRKVVENG